MWLFWVYVRICVDYAEVQISAQLACLSSDTACGTCVYLGHCVQGVYYDHVSSWMCARCAPACVTLADTWVTLADDSLHS